MFSNNIMQRLYTLTVQEFISPAYEEAGDINSCMINVLIDALLCGAYELLQ